MSVSIYEKTFNTLKAYESRLMELVQELENEKVIKKDIDKVRLILTKCQSAKLHFNDK